MHPVEVTLPTEKLLKKVDFIVDDNSFEPGTDVELVKAQFIANYINEVHGIQLPYDFVEQLSNVYKSHPSGPFYLNTTHIDAIITACELWKPYIVPNKFNNLLCCELLSFANNHISKIDDSTILSIPGVELAVKPESNFSTLVSEVGEVFKSN